MTTAFSTVLSVSLWTAFLSVLAIIGIIVAGGFIVALFGRMVLSLFHGSQDNDTAQKSQPIYNSNDMGDGYQMLEDEKANQVVAEKVNASEDFNYSMVDDEKAKEEEEALNKELAQAEEDDFFKDLTNEGDSLEDDDDIMGMIDEISNEVLDEEVSPSESEQSSVLDKYSIDTFFNDVEAEEIEDIEEQVIDIEDIVDVETLEHINNLKQQVKEIISGMEQNNNKTFNEQLIDILNELRVANNKSKLISKEDAEREIIELKKQLEDARRDMENQLEIRLANKDAEIQERLQDQLTKSNAEIEDLKSQLNTLLEKLGESDEGAKPVEDADIEALRDEVKKMIEDMRAETEIHNNEFNAQLIAILNEMKEVALKQSEQGKIETAEDAIEEVSEWQSELEQSQVEMEKQFKEQMTYTDEEMKAELQAQMEKYNAEIAELKEQMNTLINEFKQENESAKAENQALIDELENERQERIKLEQAKLEEEQEQLTQLENLRKENERLADMLQEREASVYEPLTEEEMSDLYSETTDIDYSAIKQMYEDQIDSKVQEGFEQSKAEIDALKEQVSRLTAFMEEREGTIAEQMNVHEVRATDFDVETAKEITIKEVEDRVNEKLSEYIDQIDGLAAQLEEIKEEVENRYKDQLADTESGMEYDTINDLQSSAEQITSIQNDLQEIKELLVKEQENVTETSKECVEELESVREDKAEKAKQELEDEADVAIVGPKHNQVALVASETVEEEIAEIDLQTVKELTQAEIDELIEARLQDSNKEIQALKEQVEKLQQDIAVKDEELEKVQAEASNVPAVRSPLFDIEAIKKITAQEVEVKVQERLAEAMQEIEEMKKQLEISKQEIEKQYKESKDTAEEEVKDKLKSSAAEVVELKEQLEDLTEQIELEHKEAKKNSEVIAEQLEQERKEKDEIAKQQLLELDNSNQELPVVTTETNVTVIGPKNNQIALVTSDVALSESVVEDILPTIDIDTVRRLTEQEIEEKVEQRMTSSTIEIEELKKQILTLSIQIKEIKEGGNPDTDTRPLVFHYSTEEAYLERLAVLEERLKIAKKDFKINAKELRPLEKVSKTLERDKAKLRRKEAIVAKKKVALYGVNNYVDMDQEKAEKLAQELELLDGLRLSVSHCEEVMNANIDRYPILVRTNQILKDNIANIESDIATLNKELTALRDKNSQE